MWACVARRNGNGCTTPPWTGPSGPRGKRHRRRRNSGIRAQSPQCSVSRKLMRRHDAGTSEQFHVPERGAGTPHVAVPPPGLQNGARVDSPSAHLRASYSGIPESVGCLMGHKVVVSSFLPYVPNLQLSPGFKAASDECIASMNTWLRQMFGTSQRTLVLPDGILVVSPETYRRLNEL